jgi:hypothetical protein
LHQRTQITQIPANAISNLARHPNGGNRQSLPQADATPRGWFAIHARRKFADSSHRCGCSWGGPKVGRCRPRQHNSVNTNDYQTKDSSGGRDPGQGVADKRSLRENLSNCKHPNRPVHRQKPQKLLPCGITWVGG